MFLDCFFLLLRLLLVHDDLPKIVHKVVIGHLDAVLTDDHYGLLLVLHYELKLCLLFNFTLQVVYQLRINSLENSYNYGPNSESKYKD